MRAHAHVCELENRDSKEVEEYDKPSAPQSFEATQRQSRIVSSTHLDLLQTNTIKVTH